MEQPLPPRVTLVSDSTKSVGDVIPREFRAWRPVVRNGKPAGISYCYPCSAAQKPCDCGTIEQALAGLPTTGTGRMLPLKRMSRIQPPIFKGKGALLPAKLPVPGPRPPVRPDPDDKFKGTVDE